MDSKYNVGDILQATGQDSSQHHYLVMELFFMDDKARGYRLMKLETGFFYKEFIHGIDSAEWIEMVA